MNGDTIAAIATAAGSGSISIIRVSGDDAVSLVDSCFFGKENLVDVPSHTINYGWIGRAKDDLIDEVLVLIMRAPKSYTAEDVVEIQCHGGGMCAGDILDLLIERGVRAAEPGEFTKRAFLNGRIDLSQAESVMEMIGAKSELAVKTAGSHLRGDIKKSITDLRNVILDRTAYLEAAIDDPEHIELDDFGARLVKDLEPIRQEISHMIDSFQNGRHISEGIRTAIIGPPNAGKSSFLNCILREDRAIVTDIAGTTRDTLEEDLRIGSFVLRLIDTAGIRNTTDPIEKIGVERARDAYEDADIVICILDCSISPSEDDLKLIKQCMDKRSLFLLNKSDLLDNDTTPQIYDVIISLMEKNNKDNYKSNIIRFSAKTGEGLQTLESRLEDILLTEFYSDFRSDNNEPVITSIRHKEALLDALKYIDSIFETVDLGFPEDLLGADLMGVYESLGRITGETIEDDLADKIFADFCMGK